MENQRETFNGHPIYALSEIAMSLHNVIERTYPQPYFIKAEILKLNYYPHSGHCYPELIEKEGDKIKAEIRGVIWSTQYQQINARFKRITGEPLRENISILCLAKIEYSPKHGLALHIQDIEPTFTLGELMKNRAECIEKLKKEGIFENNRKLQLPLLPKRIAVISVETSKGYSDFITTLRENRDGYCFETTLFPSILQGEKAITGITSQLEVIENRKADFDCVVIVRGGGGDVGLSCYDDYQMAHMVATYPLPVLTGIGHSTNLTVVDMVAHTHKITPTEVAYTLLQSFKNFDEIVETCRRRIADIAEKRIAKQKLEQTLVENRFKQSASSLLQKQRNTLLTISQNLSLYVQRLTIEQHNLLNNFAKSVSRTAPQHVKQQQERLSDLSSQITIHSGRLLQNAKQSLTNTEEKIALLHPDNILKRGFSITMKDGKAVMKTSELKAGDIIRTRFYEGETESVVKS
ncbi:MAG: exodeoxyribonuclease VII large subunit [Bacteroidales bacterium]|nr:exodeoxyribonuclease VII large subunit [Bacteroidales bacterium]